MKRKTCDYCGTEYNPQMEKCPLCGKGEGEAPVRAGKSAGGARLASSEASGNTAGQDAVPRWMWILTCVMLALAVTIGLVYFLVSMEYIGGDRSASQPVIVQPVEEEPEVQQPVEQEPKEPELGPCVGMILNRKELLMDEQGSHVFLMAVTSPTKCSDPVVFTSKDETVATVDSDGMITAVAEGETEIVVTCGTVEAVCSVVCDFPDVEPEDETETEPEEQPEETTEEEEQVTPPELSSTDFTLFRPGEETVLHVRNAPAGAAVTYTSSNPNVATVTDTGLVKATGNGTATITVMVNDVKLTCIARCNLGSTTENNDGGTVEVPDNAVYTLSHTDVTLFRQGETFVLVLQDEAGNKVSGAVFASSNSSVCTVDGSGRVTAVTKGTGTVTVTYGGRAYSCIVRCQLT